MNLLRSSTMDGVDRLTPGGGDVPGGMFSVGFESGIARRSSPIGMTKQRPNSMRVNDRERTSAALRSSHLVRVLDLQARIGVEPSERA